MKTLTLTRTSAVILTFMPALAILTSCSPKQPVTGKEATAIRDTETSDGDRDETVRETPEEKDEDPYLPGYATEEDYRTRHTGSAAYIAGTTVIISVFVDEPGSEWTDEEKQTALGICDIAYSFIEDELKGSYDVDCSLIYDWTSDPELMTEVSCDEDIPVYVTSEEEPHMDELELEWAESTPYLELMKKYDTDSVAFLYLVTHEGCSYSSMHFTDDGDKLWNEGSLLYLRDMYSPELDYETPSVYAHELLHLFGAEDLYDSGVFSEKTYETIETVCPDDLMLSTFDTINGVYTTYPDHVCRRITPVTAYLLGIGDEDAVKDLPELVREEPACFSGSASDRPF